MTRRDQKSTMRKNFTHRRASTGLALILLLVMLAQGQRAVRIIDLMEFEGITLVAFGESIGDQMRVLSSGDYNGDGLSDMLIGAHLANNPTIQRTDSGSAYIVLGSRQFIPVELRDLGEPDEPKPDVFLFGAEPDDRLGVSATSGDVNGDGFDDIIISAPNADGPGNSRQNAGEVYIFFGSSELGPGIVRDVAGMLGAGPDITIFGEELNSGLGASVALGDVNGDDLMDLIIGAPGTFGPQNTRARAGSVYAILGGPKLREHGVIDLTDPRAGADLVIYGADPLDGIGFAVKAGDLNGDGFDDVVFSTPNADGPGNLRRDAGEVHVLFGGRNITDQRVRDVAGQFGPRVNLVIYGQEIGDGLGASLAIGDVSGDQIDDLAIGAFLADGPDNVRFNAGEVHVILGNPMLPFEEARDLGAQAGRLVDLTVFGADVADGLGVALNIGDADGDGVNDLIMGAPLADGPDNTRTNSGEVYILLGGVRLFDGLPRDLSGQTGRPADLILFGIDGASFGTTIALSDIDGDQLNDLLVGAPTVAGPDNLRSSSGAAFVISLR